MSSKKQIIGALLLSAFFSLGCGCKWFETRAQLQELFDKSDVVVVGLPVKSLDADKPGNKRYLGYQVLLQVISSPKGLLHDDTVLVLQAAGNCNRQFRRSDTVLVFGSNIKAVKRRRQSAYSDYDEFDWDRQTFYASRREGHFITYNRLHKAYPSISTTQCISFTMRDSLAVSFVRSKRH